jgi:hypothetical protein
MMEGHLDEVVLPGLEEMHEEAAKMISLSHEKVILQSWCVLWIRLVSQVIRDIATAAEAAWQVILVH